MLPSQPLQVSDGWSGREESSFTYRQMAGSQINDVWNNFEKLNEELFFFFPRSVQIVGLVTYIKFP